LLSGPARLTQGVGAATLVVIEHRKQVMKKAILFSLMLLALAALVLGLMSRGGKPSVLILRNTGTNSVFVRTSPPPKLPHFAFTLRSWPPMAKPVPLNAVILNGGCVVTQKFPHGARIELCTRIPSANRFEAVERRDGVILTDGYSPATSNLQFRTVWQGKVRRLEAEVNGDAPTNHEFQVIKVVE
jgi:hypothetical protein